jgi:predicted Zn-dependent protease
VVNAFCTPGGYIYVYTGLIKMIDNEATLAAVLAHEIAHAERRHSTKRMTNALGLEMISSLALGNESDETSKVVANLFTGMALLKNSRDDEYESDESSFLYLKSVNKWYPGAMKMFFDKMSDAPDDIGLKTILSTHPVGQDRIDAINAKLKQYNIKPPTEANLFVKKYREFVNSLQ